MSRKARPNYLRQIVANVTEGIGSPGQKVDEESRDICCLGEFCNPRSADGQL